MQTSPGVPRRVFSSHLVTLVTGGVRSGKSRFAVELAKGFGRRILYVATCRPADLEMRRRVARHRAERPRHWTTIEDPADLPTTLGHLPRRTEGVVVDCLTMYVSALVARGEADRAVTQALRRLCTALRRVHAPVVVVTNEVGCGVVPEQPLGRRFRDIAGLANQMVASAADRVILMVSGIPLPLK